MRVNDKQFTGDEKVSKREMKRERERSVFSFIYAAGTFDGLSKRKKPLTERKNSRRKAL